MFLVWVTVFICHVSFCMTMEKAVFYFTRLRPVEEVCSTTSRSEKWQCLWLLRYPRRAGKVQDWYPFSFFFLSMRCSIVFILLIIILSVILSFCWSGCLDWKVKLGKVFVTFLFSEDFPIFTLWNVDLILFSGFLLTCCTDVYHITMYKVNMQVCSLCRINVYTE